MNIIKQNGGDLNWFNAAINSDITLLKANLQCGKLKNIKIFASCRDINIVNIDGNTALMLAIINVFNKVFNNKAIKYNNTNIFNDRMYNLLCDSIIFLYNMNYYNFLHSIIYDNNSIYNIKNFKALINRIHNENGYLPHYLYIYKLLFSDNYKPLIKNYTSSPFTSSSSLSSSSSSINSILYFLVKNNFTSFL